VVGPWLPGCWRIDTPFRWGDGVGKDGASGTVADACVSCTGR
jgi:hypothetical protein